MYYTGLFAGKAVKENWVEGSGPPAPVINVVAGAY